MSDELWHEDVLGALQAERCEAPDCTGVPAGVHKQGRSERTLCREHAPAWAQGSVPPATPAWRRVTLGELVSLRHERDAAQSRFDAAWGPFYAAMQESAPN